MTDKQYKNIVIEREDGITFLMLNRPDKRNAMSPELHYDMDDALDWLATDKDTKVLVLGGKGEAWCAGQDLRLYFRATQDIRGRYKANNASHNWRWERLSNFRRRPSPWSTVSPLGRVHAALRLRFCGRGGGRHLGLPR
jgi:trans-feruloyl-CoA hydratase/vanillin synthase